MFLLSVLKESLAEQQSANMKKKVTLENLLVKVCAHRQDVPIDSPPNHSAPFTDVMVGM